MIDILYLEILFTNATVHIYVQFLNLFGFIVVCGFKLQIFIFFFNLRTNGSLTIYCPNNSLFSHHWNWSSYYILNLDKCKGLFQCMLICTALVHSFLTS